MKIDFWGTQIEVPHGTKYVTMDDKKSCDLGFGITAWTRKPIANKIGSEDQFWICIGDPGTNIQLARSKWPRVKWHASLVTI